MSAPTGTAVNQPGRNVPEGFMAPEAMLAYLQERLEAKLLDAIVAYDQLTVVISPEGWVDAVRLCKSDPGLDCRFWEFLDAVDRGEDGFDVNCHVYSPQHRHSVTLRCHVPGGRDKPVLPSVAGVYRGANWSERETYDMFGIEFEGHPGLEPRILTIENFEGWPLRKDFLLTTREAKPWPGAKEPGESTDDAGSATASDAPAAPEDKAAAAKAKAERAKAKAAEMRAKKAAERAAAQSEEGGDAAASDQAAASDAQQTTDDEATAAADAQPGSDLIADSAEEFGGGDTEGEAAAAVATAEGDPTASTPEGAAEVADSSIAKDAAAGAPQGDTAEGAPQDSAATDEPVVNAEGEAAAAQGAPPAASTSPGIEAEGRHGGAEQQSGAKPAAETPGMTSPTQDQEGARKAEETPAPGPDSDQPLAPEPGASSTPHGGSPTKAEDDVPLVPAPGAEAAPLDSDRPTDDVDDDVAGVDRRAEDAADSAAAGVTQERVEEGRAPSSPSERTDAADRADPDRDLASDHAADETDTAEPDAGEGERP